MATKFGQKLAKIALISVLCKKSRKFPPEWYITSVVQIAIKRRSYRLLDTYCVVGPIVGPIGLADGRLV